MMKGATGVLGEERGRTNILGRAHETHTRAVWGTVRCQDRLVIVTSLICICCYAPLSNKHKINDVIMTSRSYHVTITSPPLTLTEESNHFLQQPHSERLYFTYSPRLCHKF